MKGWPPPKGLEFVVIRREENFPLITGGMAIIRRFSTVEEGRNCGVEVTGKDVGLVRFSTRQIIDFWFHVHKTHFPYRGTLYYMYVQNVCVGIFLLRR